MTVATNTQFPSFAEAVRRTNPDGSIAEIAEVLQKGCPIIEDIPFFEANGMDGHKFTARNSLPSIAFRQLNKGVASGKSTTNQVTEPTCQMEAYSVVDVDEADLNGNAMEFRASEDDAFLEAMSEQAESSLIYDSHTTDSDRMTGILPRYNSTTGPGGKQIVIHDAAASGNDQASMLLVGWGKNTVFGMFPRGSHGGLKVTDKGALTWQDPNNAGTQFEAYVTNFKWKLGLVVRDYRYVAPIMNIDTGNLVATGNLLIQSCIKALYKIPRPERARMVWYAPRLIAQFLHLQAVDSVKQSTLRIEEVGGKPVTMLLGFPVRIADQMNATQAPIS